MTTPTALPPGLLEQARLVRSLGGTARPTGQCRPDGACLERKTVGEGGTSETRERPGEAREPGGANGSSA